MIAEWLAGCRVEEVGPGQEGTLQRITVRKDCDCSFGLKSNLILASPSPIVHRIRSMWRGYLFQLFSPFATSRLSICNIDREWRNKIIQWQQKTSPTAVSIEGAPVCLKSFVLAHKLFNSQPPISPIRKRFNF